MSKAEGKNPNRDNALRLARLGVFVFPVDPITKHPRMKWKEFSTNDPVKVAAYWRAHPGAAAAIDMGKSGLVAIDCDRNHGPDGDAPDGVAAFDAVIAELKVDLSAVPAVDTPNVGLHYIWRQPVDAVELGPITNSAKSLPAGVDVRGAGGYILAPGTQRPDGKAYLPAPGHPNFFDSVEAGTLPNLPAALARHIRSGGPNPPPPVGESRPLSSRLSREAIFAWGMLELRVAELKAAKPGGRNTLLNETAYTSGKLATLGGPELDDVKAKLVAACEANGLLVDDGPDKCADTIERGFLAGMNSPSAPAPLGLEASDAALVARLDATPFPLIIQRPFRVARGSTISTTSRNTCPRPLRPAVPARAR